MNMIKKYMKKYEVPILIGVSTVVVGHIAKRYLRKDIVGVGSLQSAGETFILVSLAGIVVQDVKSRNYI